jgi:hypothetical protein
VQYPDYKPSLASPPLTDDELQALDDLLSALPGEQAMNIEMLDGYLTALLLAPTPVAQRRAADWMPVVWGGDGDGSAPFASGKQKKNAIVLVLRHLHAIDDALHRHPDRWEPVFSVADAAGTEYADAETGAPASCTPPRKNPTPGASSSTTPHWARCCCRWPCWVVTRASSPRPTPNAWPTPSTATHSAAPCPTVCWRWPSASADVLNQCSAAGRDGGAAACGGCGCQWASSCTNSSSGRGRDTR